ncbi:MAG: DUF4194 domain-containing protein [Spirochaetaceae bacterium]|jgi:hypothetical protein|nr:DUF4194 domain-containing protein [Spirochaetaceae bacterium]
MLEEFEKLSSNEKEDFRRMANYLLSHTYLVRHEYQPSQHMTLPNRDYQLVSRLFPLFEEYFALSDWRLEKDDHYGIISLSNKNAHNRLQLNRFTTLFLYICRLIYEKGREEAGRFHIVKTSTSEVIGEMNTLEVLDKKRTTQKDRIEAQRTLAHFNIIQKMETAPWSGDGNHFLILPSVLSIISNRTINEVKKKVEELKTSGAKNQTDEETGG